MVSERLQLVEGVAARLAEAAAAGRRVAGALYGLEAGGARLVVAAAGQDLEPGKATPRDLELLNEMLPCGVEPLGVFGVGCEVEQLVVLAGQLPPLTQPSQVPVVLWRGEDARLAARLCPGELGTELEVGELGLAEYRALTTLVRVRGRLELQCGQTASEVSNAFRHLIEKVSCPYGAFQLEGGRLVYLHKFLDRPAGRGWTREAGQEAGQETEDCYLVGAEPNTTVAELWALTAPVQEEDGWGAEQTKQVKVEPRDRMEFSVLWNYSNPACTSRTIGCAPIVHREAKPGPTCLIPVPVDALGVIPTTAPASLLLEVLKGCVGRQVGDVAAAVLSELKMKGTVSTPEIFHFLPAGLAHHITLVYTAAATQDAFAAFRRSVHTSFLLPADRPLFRRGCAVEWAGRGDRLPLRSPHRGLEARHGVGGAAAVALVQGSYTYHHYLQDGAQDDGWGCAYRSLQTIVSWLRQQGLTETAVPDHKQIQKCLVDIGDKEAKFIGSKQWIGSTEVGFVLETSCGVESRFLSVSAGSDLASRARELLLHFQTEGSPVMIGGGVYAHTLLGVAWDEATGDTRWLVLDPHYTGQEDLKTIQTKGWVGWKGPSFWNQTAFYNMCLPQRPRDQI